jgi:hypothetical protein
MSLTDLEIRQHTQPIEAELNKKREECDIPKWCPLPESKDLKAKKG